MLEFLIWRTAIRPLVLEQHFGVEFARVRKCHLDLGAGVALHDVVVGYDNAAGCDDHAGAQRALQAVVLAELTPKSCSRSGLLKPCRTRWRT